MPRFQMLERIYRNYDDDPARIAIQEAGSATTYEQLVGLVDGITDRLSHDGVRSGSIVALAMNPSARLVATMIACAKIGATYVPIDPRHDSSRTARIIEIAKPRIVVSDGPEGDCHFSTNSAATGDNDEVNEDVLYVIFTSGTTGTPKGVCIAPSSLDALFAATQNLFEFGKDDRWLLAHSPAFDFSVWEIWMPLATGSTIFIPSFEKLRDPAALSALIRDEKITVLNQTPTSFQALSQYMMAGNIHPDSLRYIIFGGEKLLSQHIAKWVSRHGTKRPAIVNMYGITEVTVHATYQEISDVCVFDRGSLIGRSLPGFESRVLDVDGNEATEGELYLSGPQLAIGYLGNDTATQSSFVELDDKRFYRTGDLVTVESDGRLIYIGRRDRQVKISGHRIELSEVEQALTNHPSVSGAIAFLHTSATGHSRIVCGFIAGAGIPLRPKDLRAFLQMALPAYMIPAEIFPLDEIPTNINGKVDLDQIQVMWIKSRPLSLGGTHEQQS